MTPEELLALARGGGDLEALAADREAVADAVGERAVEEGGDGHAGFASSVVMSARRSPSGAGPAP